MKQNDKTSSILARWFSEAKPGRLPLSSLGQLTTLTNSKCNGRTLAVAKRPKPYDIGMAVGNVNQAFN